MDFYKVYLAPKALFASENIDKSGRMLYNESVDLSTKEMGRIFAVVDRYEQFSGLISGAYRQIQKLEREEMEKYGFKGAFAQYLLAMNHHPEGLTAAQLCDACDKDKAAVSRVLAEMEEKGLVQKTGEGAHAYRAMLMLTDKGHHAADFVARRAMIAVSKAGEGLSDADRKIFYAALELINVNLKKICDDGIPDTI
ncbi:MAG: MarR family transcriptional regulator [Clostridia bacterium]|nr:MarR family transcriptional regulator [Clostridia bacterium]